MVQYETLKLAEAVCPNLSYVKQTVLALHYCLSACHLFVIDLNFTEKLTDI